jgi:hypothetical protein
MKHRPEGTHTVHVWYVLQIWKHENMKERNMRHEEKRKENNGKEKKWTDMKRKRTRREKEQSDHTSLARNRTRQPCYPLPHLPSPSSKLRPPTSYLQPPTSYLQPHTSNLQLPSTLTLAWLHKLSPWKLSRSLDTPYRSMKYRPEETHTVHVWCVLQVCKHEIWQYDNITI